MIEVSTQKGKKRVEFRSNPAYPSAPGAFTGIEKELRLIIDRNKPVTTQTQGE
jgi:hypothetical protein